MRPLIEQYELEDGRRLNLLARGRVVNLAAGEGHPAAVMDVSFALQALCVEDLVRRRGELPAGVQAVPESIDREVATLKLAALGVAIDEPTPSSSTTGNPGPEVARAASATALLRRSSLQHGSHELLTAPALRGGIDLGGTKIEAIVVDADQHDARVVAASRHRRPVGRRTVAAELVAAMSGACQAAGVEPAALSRRRGRLARA